MNQELFEKIVSKSTLEQQVMHNIKEVFSLFKIVLEETQSAFQNYIQKRKDNISLEYNDLKGFEIEMTFGSDVLRFVMHSNIFLIPRYDPINNTSYVKEDEERGFCGVINIYNFLSDSFKYKRYDDIGYLIGRIFVNKENHYFIQGKRELSRFLNHFSDLVIDKTAIEEVVYSAMMYTLNFSLLIPPYDQVKEVSVLNFQTEMDNMKLIPTGKRLGFRFAADVNDNEQ